ncbi:MAG: type IX secretion system outer membrane channel protein PorV [Bacteroidales bacterium]|jgi:hypothetical protein|nr:type IX secretion system outer membrane channel protein PorV [Bacteroidales bacterium]
MTNTLKTLSVIVAVALSHNAVAQQVNPGGDDIIGREHSYNAITTAVPFLTIAADSRAGGMGDVGAATTADVWSQQWNASKYVLAQSDMSVGLAYTPWLAHITNDIHLLYAAGYKKFSSGNDAIGASLRYFSVGEIPAYDENGTSLGYNISPTEFALDFSYSRKLADKFVMGITGRFIYSNLNAAQSDADYRPGKAVAADISGTYIEPKLRLGSMPASFRAGFNISNIGSKIAYTSNNRDFIPTNLKLGAGMELEIDKHNDLGFYLDFNKLLVPTPPLYGYDADSNRTIVKGRDPNVGPIAGIFQSFYDAPDGFSEELAEIMVSGGVEYWYNKQFAVRGGYFHESRIKGNRKFFSVGIGLRMNVMGLDVAYLVPLQGTNSPLANTFRVSLKFDLNRS